MVEYLERVQKTTFQCHANGKRQLFLQRDIVNCVSIKLRRPVDLTIFRIEETHRNPSAFWLDPGTAFKHMVDLAVHV